MKIRSVLSTAKHLANNLRRRLWKQRTAPVLIVTRDPSGKKVARILRRLDFFCPTGSSRVRCLRSVSTLDVVSSSLVLEVDRGDVPSALYKLFDHVFDVDFERNHLDGWQLCEISQYLAGGATQARRTLSR